MILIDALNTYLKLNFKEYKGHFVINSHTTKVGVGNATKKYTIELWYILNKEKKLVLQTSLMDRVITSSKEESINKKIEKDFYLLFLPFLINNFNDIINNDLD